MLFKAKVVEDRQAGKLMIALGTISIVFVAISMILPDLGEIVPFFIATVIMITIVMAIIYKGDLSSYSLRNDMKVYVDGMQICQLVFPYKDISKLNFEFQSYEENTHSKRQNNRGNGSFGLGNNLSFIYKNQQFNYQFYLQNRNHYFQFINMLEQLYEHHIPFTENNLKGKTFLMKNVGEDELRIYKKYYQFD